MGKGGKRVGFLLKPDKSVAGKLVAELAALCRQHGHTPVVLAEDEVAVEGARIVPEEEFGRSVDLAVSLGGDGTMLRTSALIGDARVPVLGINLGRLGFLSPFDPQDAAAALLAALDGRLDIGHRMRLAVRYQPFGGTPVLVTALNDVVIHQGTMARLVELEARLDDQLITEYRADGLIVASPTGSTAYNLAAGGPIVMPGLSAIAITPICAHALTNRPLVVPAHSDIAIKLDGKSQSVVLTVDGRWARSFLPNDVVHVTAADSPLRHFTSPDKPFFDILREKLNWGVRND